MECIAVQIAMGRAEESRGNKRWQPHGRDKSQAFGAARTPVPNCSRICYPFLQSSWWHLLFFDQNIYFGCSPINDMDLFCWPSQNSDRICKCSYYCEVHNKFLEQLRSYWRQEVLKVNAKELNSTLESRYLEISRLDILRLDISRYQDIRTKLIFKA